MRPGVELFVANEEASSDAPFSDDHFAWIKQRYEYRGAPDSAKLHGLLQEFGPEIVLTCWHIREYRRACDALRGRAVRVGCLDNQWRGTLRQRIGVLTSPVYLRRYFDALFVPGERQAEWARRMGFEESRIWRGVLSAEVSRFWAVRGEERPPAFLYVGRLSPEKGITALIDAYGQYRARAEAPWPLIVAGTGPLAGMIRQEGIVCRGFVQLREIPALFAEAACFVLPSTFEPWAVVIHEAAAAGLPIICTGECGASVHLVQDGYNGYVVEAGNDEVLTNTLLRMAELPAERRRHMGEASRGLSRQFTPERWANCVLENGSALLEEIRKPLSKAAKL
ncbi:MAG: glycosyltransferase family 4 protein [Candidatus Korobacteraceae bacterium]